MIFVFITNMFEYLFITKIYMNPFTYYKNNCLFSFIKITWLVKALFVSQTSNMCDGEFQNVIQVGFIQCGLRFFT
jgi:hypothetical protein